MYLRMEHVSCARTTIVCSKTRWYLRKHIDIIFCIHNKDIMVITSRSELAHTCNKLRMYAWTNRVRSKAG